MIAIPNMEKPKECKECQWHLDFYIEDEQVGGLCTITEKDDRENTCPIIEIDLVRCGECKWYEPRHIEENGIECAGQCIWHIGLKTYCDAHDRENPEDRPRMIIFREPTDFCSYGERRADE